MSIFGQAVSNLTAGDLRELLEAQAVENVRLEFKRDVPARDEALKKLSSCANTYGGYLVVGVDADSKDGRIKSLVGVEPQANYKQTIVQWCAGGITPVIQVDVSDAIALSTSDGRVCYVVKVSESELAPHFLNDRKGIWVRTNEFSSRFEARLANEAELRHLADRRSLVWQRRANLIARARARFQTFADVRYGELGSRPDGIGARFSLGVIPRFPAQNIATHPQLRTILQQSLLNWRGTSFPRVSNGFVSQHESEIVLGSGSNFSLFEANTWGLLFYATEIELQSEKYSGIHLNSFLGQVLVFLKHAQVVASKLGLTGPLSIEMQLQGIRGAKWIYFEFGQFPREGQSSELDNEAQLAIETTVEELQEQLDVVCQRVLTFVFFATNWASVVESEGSLRKMVEMGCAFNQWQVDQLRG